MWSFLERTWKIIQSKQKIKHAQQASLRKTNQKFLRGKFDTFEWRQITFNDINICSGLKYYTLLWKHLQFNHHNLIRLVIIT